MCNVLNQIQIQCNSNLIVTDSVIFHVAYVSLSEVSISSSALWEIGQTGSAYVNH